MIRILAVCGAPFTYGELGLLLNFADDLPTGQTEIVYLTSANHHPILRRKGCRGLFLESADRETNERKLEAFLIGYHPDIILIPDFLSLWYTKFLYGLSLTFWQQLDIPVVSFDSHGWTDIGYCVDIAGKKVDLTDPNDIATFASTNWFAEILPVSPFRSPGYVADNPLALPLCRNSPVSRAEKLHWRNQTGCRLGQKMVFLIGLFDHQQAVCHEILPLMAQAFNDSPQMVRAARGISDMAERVQAFLPRLLHPLGNDIRIVTVSHMTADTLVNWENLEVTNLPLLDEAKYDNLIGSADLVLSLNEISGSLVKAARAGVPAFVLGQGLDATKLKNLFPEIREEALYRWRYFPVGMYDYYTPILMPDPMGGSCLHGEIFEACQSGISLRLLLDDSLIRSKFDERQALLSRQMDQLSAPHEVFETLLARLNLEAVAWN